MGKDYIPMEDHARIMQEKDYEIEMFRKNEHFYIIALRLSGRREELEDKAEKMIKTFGRLRALKESRKFDGKKTIKNRLDIKIKILLNIKQFLII